MYLTFTSKADKRLIAGETKLSPSSRLCKGTYSSGN